MPRLQVHTQLGLTSYLIWQFTVFLLWHRIFLFSIPSREKCFLSHLIKVQYQTLAIFGWMNGVGVGSDITTTGKSGSGHSDARRECHKWVPAANRHRWWSQHPHGVSRQDFWAPGSSLAKCWLFGAFFHVNLLEFQSSLSFKRSE